jgi:hypothetical protein
VVARKHHLSMTSISYTGMLFFRTLVKGGRNYSDARVTRLVTFRMKSIAWM